jgi:hypothetical protein
MSISTRCRVCKTPTETGFNINFDLVPICERCAMSITLQQVQWMSKLYNAKNPMVESEFNQFLKDDEEGITG